MESKIIKCGIGVMRNEKDPSVVAVFEDKGPERLFSYRSDEITLKKEDFVGLTKTEAFMLLSRKMNIYLTK